MLMHRSALRRNDGQARRERLFETKRAIDDDELRRPQSAFDEIVEQRPPSGFALSARVLTASSKFWPSRLTPSARRNEIDVDFLSSRTRALIGSAARDRLFQAPFTFRKTRLTSSVPTTPAKTALSARRTRRVLVAER
jgi:hypothetical protein